MLTHEYQPIELVDSIFNVIQNVCTSYSVSVQIGYSVKLVHNAESLTTATNGKNVESSSEYCIVHTTGGM